MLLLNFLLHSISASKSLHFFTRIQYLRFNLIFHLYLHLMHVFFCWKSKNAYYCNFISLTFKWHINVCDEMEGEICKKCCIGIVWIDVKIFFIGGLWTRFGIHQSVYEVVKESMLNLLQLGKVVKLVVPLMLLGSNHVIRSHMCPLRPLIYS